MTHALEPGAPVLFWVGLAGEGGAPVSRDPDGTPPDPPGFLSPKASHVFN